VCVPRQKIHEANRSGYTELLERESILEFTEKKQRIELITGKVRNLHPLLQNIFPKLPNVVTFKQTHG